MTTTFYAASATAATHAHLLHTQTASKAPWIETSFVQIPFEFFAEAIKVLSKGAQRVYVLHCKHAKATGEGAGYSYAYRETLARELGCSLSTVDRANAELESRGMIRDTGRRFQHGGAVKFQLQGASKWTFATRKIAPLTTQKCAGEDAKMRPITKAKEHLKPKEQQTASRENVVAVPQSSIVQPGATPQSQPGDSHEITLKLQELGFDAKNAAWLVSAYGESACAYQLERLSRTKDVRSPVRWLRTAITQGHRDALQSASAPEAPKPAPTPAELARNEQKRLARERIEALAAQRVFDGLSPARQNYIRRDMELRRDDGKAHSLTDSIKSQENGAFVGHLRREGMW